MIKELVNNFLEPLSPLLPLVLLLVQFNKVSAMRELRLLLFIYTLLFILNATAALLAFLDKTNIWIYDLGGITTFLSISFYMAILLKTDRFQKIIYFFIPVFTTFYLGYTYMLNDSSIFNSLGYAVLAVLISIYCVFYFLECIRFETRKLTDIYSFWVVTSFFIYFMGSFFIFITYKTMTSHGIQTGMLWGLHNIVYFVSCCIAAFGIWKLFQKKYTLSEA